VGRTNSFTVWGEPRIRFWRILEQEREDPTIEVRKGGLTRPTYWCISACGAGSLKKGSYPSQKIGNALAHHESTVSRGLESLGGMHYRSPWGRRKLIFIKGVGEGRACSAWPKSKTKYSIVLKRVMGKRPGDQRSQEAEVKGEEKITTWKKIKKKSETNRSTSPGIKNRL